MFTWRHSVICETDFVPPVVAQFLGLQLSFECTLAEHGFRLGSYWRDTRGADGFGAAAKWEPPPSSQLGASAHMDSLSIDEPSGQLVGGFHSAASAPGAAASEDGDLVQSLGQFVHSVSFPLRSCLHRPSAQEAACKVATKQVSFSSRIDFWFPAVNQVTLPSVPISSFSEVRHVGLRLPLTAACAICFSPGLSRCCSPSALSVASPVPSSCLSKGGSCRTLSGSSCGTPPIAAPGTHASSGPRPSLSFPCLSKGGSCRTLSDTLAKPVRISSISAQRCPAAVLPGLNATCFACPLDSPPPAAATFGRNRHKPKAQSLRVGASPYALSQGAPARTTVAPCLSTGSGAQPSVASVAAPSGSSLSFSVFDEVFGHRLMPSQPHWQRRDFVVFAITHSRLIGNPIGRFMEHSVAGHSTPQVSLTQHRHHDRRNAVVFDFRPLQGAVEVFDVVQVGPSPGLLPSQGPWMPRSC